MDWAGVCHTEARFDVVEPLARSLDSTPTLTPLTQYVASSSKTASPLDGEKADSFEARSQSLNLIAALTDECYPHAPVEPDELEVAYYARETHESLPVTAVASPPQEVNLMGENVQSKRKKPRKSKSNTQTITPAQAQWNQQCVSQLYNQCQKSFQGKLKTDALKFVWEYGKGRSVKCCTLTITLPSGGKRKYVNPGVFSRKKDAKPPTAALAVSMHALEFIQSGGTTAKYIQDKPGRFLVPAPLDSPVEATVESDVDDGLVRRIEQACVRWGAGRVKPYWAMLYGNRSGKKMGCALRVQLSARPRHVRVYASPAVRESLAAAKADCARIACEQGVLDFIKQWGAVVDKGGDATTKDGEDTAVDEDGDDSDSKNEVETPLTLQEFYDTFPQPFPESFCVGSDAKPLSLGEFDASAWLNTTLQSARGTKLSATFMLTTKTPAMVGLYGCLLRIDRPGESRLYLSDARFVRRADALGAACLQAMFQGVGPYIRGLGQDLDGKLTPQMKGWANELVLPTLRAEISKIPHAVLRFEHGRDVDAVGCVVILTFPSPPPPSHAEARAEEMIERRYTVPAEYRSQTDARCAAVCHAAEQGAIDFLRFRGGPLPPFYQTFHSELVAGTLVIPQEVPNGNQKKRKRGVEDQVVWKPESLDHGTRDDSGNEWNQQQEISSGHTKKRKGGSEQPGREVRRHFHYQPQADDQRTRGGDGWNQRHDIGPSLTLSAERGEPISRNSMENNSFHHANSVASSSTLNPVGSNFAESSTSAYAELF